MPIYKNGSSMSSRMQPVDTRETKKKKEKEKRKKEKKKRKKRRNTRQHRFRTSAPNKRSSVDMCKMERDRAGISVLQERGRGTEERGKWKKEKKKQKRKK